MIYVLLMISTNITHEFLVCSVLRVHSDRDESVLTQDTGVVLALAFVEHGLEVKGTYSLTRFFPIVMDIRFAS